MTRTRKTRAPEATQKPAPDIADDPTILAIVSGILQHETPRVKRIANRVREPEVLRRAHPSLLLLDMPHRFI